MSSRFESYARSAMLGLLVASQSGCSGDSDDAEDGVTSEKVIPDLSLDEFTKMCDDEAGVVETHATCGGVVSGPGFSYDVETDVFTEHTCAGHNTCSGFSCVFDE